MMNKKDWKRPAAIILFVMLLGGYYEKLNVETQAMVLPMVIFIAVAVVVARFKQLEYEMRSAQITTHKITVQTLSVLDSNGNERIAMAAEPDNPALTFYDANHTPRATLDLDHTEPTLKLEGGKGSILIAFDKEGLPNVTLQGDTDEVIWSAP
jgi:hypothetical protein